MSKLARCPLCGKKHLVDGYDRLGYTPRVYCPPCKRASSKVMEPRSDIKSMANRLNLEE